jgi:hypothetical protein
MWRNLNIIIYGALAATAIKSGKGLQWRKCGLIQIFAEAYSSTQSR